MSRIQKLVQRLKSRPKDFTYEELRKLLHGLDYKEDSGGKTSGSRVAFLHSQTGHIIRLHKPHPGNILKSYQIDQIIEELEKRGSI